MPAAQVPTYAILRRMFKFFETAPRPAPVMSIGRDFCQNGFVRIPQVFGRDSKAGDSERKLALFMVAGANNASTRRYREWLDQYDGMNGTARPAIPGDFQAFLSSAGLHII